MHAGSSRRPRAPSLRPPQLELSPQSVLPLPPPLASCLTPRSLRELCDGDGGGDDEQFSEGGSADDAESKEQPQLQPQRSSGGGGSARLSARAAAARMLADGALPRCRDDARPRQRAIAIAIAAAERSSLVCDTQSWCACMTMQGSARGGGRPTEPRWRRTSAPRLPSPSSDPPAARSSCCSQVGDAPWPMLHSFYGIYITRRGAPATQSRQAWQQHLAS
jgi:hypothetical protein